MALALIVWLGFGASFYFAVPQAQSTAGQKSARSIQSHLNELSYNLTTYIQNHDPFIQDLVREEEKQLAQDMTVLTKELTQAGQADDVKRLEKARNGVRDTTAALLTADQEALAAGRALDAAKKTAEADLTQRSRRAQHAALERFIRLTSDLQAAQMKKLEAINHFNEWREMLEKAIHETSSPAPIAAAPTGFMLPGLLLAAGVGAALLGYRRLRQDIARPIQDILQCVEAASSGDVSRMPDHWSRNEVGQLSQAVGRLISVLARSENLVYHLAALVESSGDAIISHTLDGKVLSWNKGAQRIYGYTAEEMKGQSIEILADEKSRITMKHVLERIREDERIQPFETTHQARNGRKVKTFVRVAAIYDSTREIIGASFIAEELTPAKAAAAKLVH